jgi:transcriptional regulator with XRE-family HTH domain
MQTTNEFLDAIKVRHNLPSDYKLGLLLGASSTSQVSNYRAGRSRMDEQVALKVAELLDVEPAYVVACVNHERAAAKGDDQMMAVWEILAGKFRKADEKVQAAMKHAAAVALAVILSLFVGGGPDAGAFASEVKAPSPAAQSTTLCALCQLRSADGCSRSCAGPLRRLAEPAQSARSPDDNTRHDAEPAAPSAHAVTASRQPGPAAQRRGRYLGVSASTLRRWRALDRAPRPALLALFWVSSWGQSALDADLANYATIHAGLARSRETALHNLRAKIVRLMCLAHFGSANDPVVDIDGWALTAPRSPWAQDGALRSAG